MRDTFSYFNPYSDEELQNFWANGIVVLDTSALFRGLYESNQSIRDKWISVLKQLKDTNRLWIPFQVGLEFHKNRPRVFRNSNDYKNNLKTSLTKAMDTLETHLKENGERYSNDELREINNTIKYLDKKIRNINIQDKNSISLGDDKTYNEISVIFSNVIGDEPTEEELEELKKEFTGRFLKSLPPGLSDEEKADERKHLQFNHLTKHGDQYIWKQIIEYAKGINNKVPFVFVTDDCKKDGDWFWYMQEGSNTAIGTHPYLRKEFKKHTNLDIYVTQSFHCLTKLAELFGIEAPEDKSENQGSTCDNENEFYRFCDAYREQTPMHKSLDDQNTYESLRRYMDRKRDLPLITSNEELIKLRDKRMSLANEISLQQAKIKDIMLYLEDDENGSGHNFKVISSLLNDCQAELAYLEHEYRIVDSKYIRLLQHSDF